MSRNDKIAELFADFDRNGSLDSLAEAIELTEDILANDENAKDKEIAKNRFNIYKNKQIEKAKIILSEEDDLDKVKKCWEVLNEFVMAESANSPEDIVELEKVRGELSKREDEDEVKPKSPEERKAQWDKNSRIRRIKNKLLMAKAKEQGITVTEAEIDKYIEDQKGRT